MHKKLFALVMSLVMMVTFMPSLTFTAFAETEPETEPEKQVQLAITADVHGETEKLKNWQSALKTQILSLGEDDKIDMLFGGDYYSEPNEPFPVFPDLNEYIKLCNSIIEETDANGFNGIYTCGENEYNIDNSNTLYNAFKTMPGFKRIGRAYNSVNNGKDYIVYNFGASGYYDDIGGFTKTDINKLDLDLTLITASKSFKDNPRPIFVLSHFPLHKYQHVTRNNSFASSKAEVTAKNATKVIDVLNKYPNVVFLYGHNHRERDDYGLATNINYACNKKYVVQPEGEITTENGTTPIHFTYAWTGAMGGGGTDYANGLVASVDGTQVKFDYYKSSKITPVQSITVNCTGESVFPRNNIDIDFSEGEEIEETNEYALEVDKNKNFKITVNNKTAKSSNYYVFVENEKVVQLKNKLADSRIKIRNGASKTVDFKSVAGTNGGITTIYITDGKTTKKVKVTVLGSNYFKPIDAQIIATPARPCEIIESIEVAKDATLKMAIKNDTYFTAKYTLSTEGVGVYDNNDKAIDSVVVPAKQSRVVNLSALEDTAASILIRGNNGTSSKVVLAVQPDEPIDITVATSRRSLSTITDMHIKQGEKFSIRLSNTDSKGKDQKYIITEDNATEDVDTAILSADLDTTGILVAKGTPQVITFTAENPGTTTLKIAIEGITYTPASVEVTVVENVPIEEGLMYLALGDSIGAGCKSGYDSSNPDADIKYQEYKKFGPNGEKNWNVHAVDYSYVSKFANQIGADPKVSKNGTFAGFRAKEMCYILGIPAMIGDNYKSYNTNNISWSALEKAKFDFEKVGVEDYFAYYMASSLNWKALFSKQNKELYKKYIREADVITVEFGANEFNALAQFGPLFRKLLPAIQDLLTDSSELTDGDKEKLQTAYNQLKALITGTNCEDINWDELIAGLNTVKPLVKKVGDIAELAVKSMADAALSYTYYMNNLLKYINKYGGIDNGKPTTVIVTTTPNLMTDFHMDETQLAQFLGIASIGGIKLTDIAKPALMAPAVLLMNAYVYLLAPKYNYNVAYISDLSMNPPSDAYSFHPDNNGHAYIAKQVYSTYLKAIKMSK